MNVSILGSVLMVPKGKKGAQREEESLRLGPCFLWCPRSGQLESLGGDGESL